VADFFTFNFYELQFPQYLSAEANLPDGFSVAAVSELSTWAMLLIGFAAIRRFRADASAPRVRCRSLRIAVRVEIKRGTQHKPFFDRSDCRLVLAANSPKSQPHYWFIDERTSMTRV
jgi:hypothetical protein